MHYFIDTHAHIYLPEFDADREDVISRARTAGVEKILMPNIDETSVTRMLAVEGQYAGTCFAMMGLHPCSVKQQVSRQLNETEALLSRHSFVAIGEIGTDRYWDTTYWDQQIEAFTVQAGWAAKLNLPMVIHCRHSLDETLDVVEKMQDGRLTGVFHCFSGTVQQALRAVHLGFYLGIGGVATFKNGGLDKVLPHVPADRIILETDSPYLAPVPNRGRRNEPAFLLLVAEKVAAYLGIEVEALRLLTTQNALRLFQHVR